jgi:hypothetical protein
LPVSALAAVCPLAAALILVYKEDKTAGMAELLKRSFDYRRIRAKVWYAPILLLMPGAMLLTYWMGSPVPSQRFPILALPVMFLAFFIAALGEELGWSGYITDPLQARWNALEAGILLGLVWAAWHVIPLLQANRAPIWIAWWCLDTVALRVLMVWIYNNTGKSVFAAALFHAVGNLSVVPFFAYYDPRIHGLIVAATAAIVIVAWGPRALSRDGGVGRR